MEKRDRLYNLLPAIYRKRDLEQGEPLRAFLSILENELQETEKDLDQLYDNWFIETCSEWVIPYISDLLGIQNLHPGSPGTFSQRAFVANTLAYRRRKGTAVVLEQLARDATGWNARVTEFFRLLGIAPHTNHPAIQNKGTLDLKNRNDSDLESTPFENAAHTVNTRNIKSGSKYSIPNIGIFLWPLQSYSLKDVTPYRVIGQPGCFKFDPLGMDTFLLNTPKTETDISHFAEETNVPGVLRLYALHQELKKIRNPVKDDISFSPEYFTEQDPVIQIKIGDSSRTIPAEEIVVADLTNWECPANSVNYEIWENGAKGEILKPISVAVDPLLGRLAFSEAIDSVDLNRVLVSYSYGFSSEIGGGPYNRWDTVMSALPEIAPSSENYWHVGVAKNVEPVGNETVYQTLNEAITAWNDQDEGTVGIITILDNETYIENLHGEDKIIIKENSFLLITSADWPISAGDLYSAPEREPGRLVPEHCRSHIKGNIYIDGTAPPRSARPGTLVLDGLLIEGKVDVYNGNLGKLRISHSTITDESQGVEVNASIDPLNIGYHNENLLVEIEKSIVGCINFVSSPAELSLKDSIISRLDSPAINTTESKASIQGSTIFSQSNVGLLSAENSIFMEMVTAQKRQQGCVRFCYLPLESIVPRRFRCQPDIPSNDMTRQSGIEDQNPLEIFLAKTRPRFISKSPGDPSFARLKTDCVEEILKGAEDGSEMGAFHHLKQYQRKGNLLASLDQYLPFGREAQVFEQVITRIPPPPVLDQSRPLRVTPILNSPAIQVSNIGQISFDLRWEEATLPGREGKRLTYLAYYSTEDNLDLVSTIEAFGTPNGNYQKNTSCTVTNLIPDTVYYANIVVQNEHGNKTPYGGTSAIRTLQATPPDPGNTGIIWVGDIGTQNVNLIWTKAESECCQQSQLEYRLYYSTQNNIGNLADIEINGTPFGYWQKDIDQGQVYGLNSDTRYYFNVVVKDVFGNRGIYNIAQALTFPRIIVASIQYYLGPEFDTIGIGAELISTYEAPMPANTGLIHVSNITAHSLDLDWQRAVSTVSPQQYLQYQVYLSQKNDIQTLEQIEQNGIVFSPFITDLTHFTVTGLEDYTLYFFNVVVSDLLGNKAAYHSVFAQTAPLPGSMQVYENGMMFDAVAIGGDQV